MAARCEVPVGELVDLSQLGPTDLDPLLAEEIEVWDRRFDWDFRPAADLLRRFLHIRSLSGCALRFEREVVGYAYSVCEGRKGLIGDFYLRSGYANSFREMQLLGGVVQSLMRTPGLRRIESQLMLLRNQTAGQPLPFCAHAHRHDRYFMQIHREAIARLQPEASMYRAIFAPWAERYHEDTAHLLAAAYRGHVDSEINDQYRTLPGARLFLGNIIRFPGCGRFSPESSVLALDSSTGRVCGMCLSSYVAAQSGHITQLCILPGIRRAKLGYELLRQALLKLAAAGCTSVSLTVTCSNVEAIRLYRSVGFEIGATFPALVWGGF